MKTGRQSPVSCSASLWIQITGLLLLVGIFTIQVVSISGGGLDDISKRLAASDDFFKSLIKRYPTGQLDLTLHQTFDMVESLHKLSSKANRVVETPQLERIMNTLANTNVTSLMVMVENVNRILTTETSAEVKRFISQIDVAKFNELVESSRAIEERLKNLHELKISI